MKRIVLTILSTLLSSNMVFSQALNSGSGLSNSGASKKVFFKSSKDSLLKQLQLSPSILSLIKNNDIREILKLGRLNFVKDEESDHVYIASMNSRSLALPDSISNDLRRASLPTAIDQADLNISIQMNQPWSDSALKDNGLKSMQLDVFDAVLSDIKVNATGGVQFDIAGQMIGSVRINVTNWQKLMPLIKFDSDTQHTLIEGALSLAADGPNLDVTFDITDSILYYGAIPLTKIELFKEF